MIEPLPMGINEGVVENPRLNALVRYWNEKRASRLMPSRRQLDPIEIPRLLPIVLLADAATTGARIRLMGTDATAACGQEPRGRLVDELDLGEFTPFWSQAFAVVIKSGAPVSAGSLFHRGTQLHRIESVLLPLSDDGLSVSHVFGGLLVMTIAPRVSVEPAPLVPYVSVLRSRRVTGRV